MHTIFKGECCMKKSVWKNVGIVLIVIVFFAILFFSISGFGKQSETDIKEKIKAELSYMDDSILSMSYQLTGINLADYVITKEQESSSNQQSNEQNSQSNTNTGEQSSTSSSGGQKSSENVQSESSESNVKFSLKEQSTLDTTKTNTIDWESLRLDIELLYSSWTSFLVDLHATQNVKNEDILAFSAEMDNLMIKVKEENKNDALIVLSNLYGYIPLYAEAILTEQTEQVNLYRTKSHILACSVLLEQEKWEEIPAQMAKAQEYFSDIVSQTLTNENMQNKLNKSYVLLNELNSAVALKDKEVFYVKYENLMENMQYLDFS